MLWLCVQGGIQITPKIPGDNSEATETRDDLQFTTVGRTHFKGNSCLKTSQTRPETDRLAMQYSGQTCNVSTMINST